MNKKEARTLADSIIDHFVDMLEFERRKDIRLVIQDMDEPESDNLATTLISNSHGFYSITLYLFPDTTPGDVTESICHELGHVFTAEAHRFYNTFVSDEEATESISYTVFRQGFERMAERWAVALLKLWEAKCRSKQ